jgi:hypothetical protein
MCMKWIPVNHAGGNPQPVNDLFGYIQGFCVSDGGNDRGVGRSGVLAISASSTHGSRQVPYDPLVFSRRCLVLKVDVLSLCLGEPPA